MLCDVLDQCIFSARQTQALLRDENRTLSSPGPDEVYDQDSEDSHSDVDQPRMELPHAPVMPRHWTARTHITLYPIIAVRHRPVHHLCKCPLLVNVAEDVK